MRAVLRALAPSLGIVAGFGLTLHTRTAVRDISRGVGLTSLDNAFLTMITVEWAPKPYSNY